MEVYLVATATVTGIYILLTLGLSLQYGFTGLINFGHVGFFALGAYATAILSTRGYPVALGIIAAIALAMAAAIPVGSLAIRLKEDYLAIVTLAFSEIMRIALTAEQWLTGGVNGIAGIPRPLSGLGIGGVADIIYLAFVVVIDVLAVVMVIVVTRSPFGRLIQAIRDDEHAVRALGKEPAGYKVAVFVIGAALAGLAGALQSHYITYVSPEQFTPIVTFYIWIAMILGGADRISGAVIGAVMLVVFLEGTRFLRDLVPWIGPIEMSSMRLMTVGLALVLCTIHMPDGIVGRFARR